MKYKILSGILEKKKNISDNTNKIQIKPENLMYQCRFLG